MGTETLNKALGGALAALRQPEAKLVRLHGRSAAGFYIESPHKSFRGQDEVAAKLLERNDVQPLRSWVAGTGGPQSWRLGNWREWTR